MERKEFLKTLGAGAAFAITFSCLHGCSDKGGGENPLIPELPGEGFTVDLNAASSANLQNNGGFIFVKSKQTFTENDVIVVRNLEGNIVAASKICSHEGNPNIDFFEENGGIFECDVHGARFNQAGQPLNSVTTNPLKIFQTELLPNNILRIFE
ncbi:ubiquinol-cytochrome c reductase iron-sulfur subunit [Cellulophaga sp. Hel_I_12]|uniref:QcrA and Rieske domain-containing protein n=1 Tax=Cellulophaga sp. Hel_I_12 TaxID=1249972 RepID=UPI000648930A|nr:Rieske (2Fe-2S) protein [Cellulophaga sp. Hel_I_12]